MVKRVNAHLVTSREVGINAVILRAVSAQPSEAVPADRQEKGNICAECAFPEDSVELSNEAKSKSRAASATNGSPALSARKCMGSKDTNFDGALSAKELGVSKTVLAMLDQNADGEVDEAELRSRDEHAPRG